MTELEFGSQYGPHLRAYAARDQITVKTGDYHDIDGGVSGRYYLRGAEAVELALFLLRHAPTDEESERYPVAEQSSQLDGLVPFLRDVDATHKEKAIALLAASRQEYWYARNDEQIAGPPAGYDGFEPWAMNTISMLDGVLERMEDG